MKESLADPKFKTKQALIADHLILIEN